MTPRLKIDEQEEHMKTSGMLAITFVLLAYGSAAVAADTTGQMIRTDAPKGITTAFFTCIDKAGSDTVALGGCLSAEKTNQDTRLNATYKTLLGKLNGKAKDALVSAQREWLALHNKSGDFEVLLYGNETVADLQITQNEIFQLCDRANTLDKYLAVANDH
jgi:uncharacterized protein YecT (DUF1311 family)